MTSRPAAVAIALALGCAVTAGCASTTLTKSDATSGVHQVDLTAQSTSAVTDLRYTLDPHPLGPSAVGLYIETKTATRSLRVTAGTRVTMTGGSDSALFDAPATPSALAPASSITCTITVDGVMKASSTVNGPKGLLPTCSASAYVGHRPRALWHALKLGAAGLCVVIIVAALGALLIPRRERSMTRPGSAAADGTDIV